MESALPDRGVAAHRGGAAHRPENTLAALREAVRLGAHQVEIDLRRCADGAVVVIHDASVERTTGGRGAVAALRVADLRRLDAGRHFSAEFAGERIPTLEEALAVLPRDVWINLQIKAGEPIAGEVVRAVAAAGRLGQCLLACGSSAAREARAAHPGVRICDLARQRSRAEYVAHAAATGASFVQFHHLRGLPTAQEVERAHRAGLRVNYFCGPGEREVEALFAVGVDFPLVDDVAAALAAARRHGIGPRGALAAPS